MLIKEKIRDEKVIVTMDDKEKNMISSQIKKIINEYSKPIEELIKKPLDTIDEFEDSLISAIRKLAK